MKKSNVFAEIGHIMRDCGIFSIRLADDGTLQGTLNNLEQKVMEAKTDPEIQMDALRRIDILRKKHLAKIA